MYAAANLDALNNLAAANNICLRAPYAAAIRSLRRVDSIPSGAAVRNVDCVVVPALVTRNINVRPSARSVRCRSLISQVGFLVEMIVSAMWAIKRLPTDRERGLGGKVEVRQRVFDLGVRNVELQFGQLNAQLAITTSRVGPVIAT